MAGKRMKLKMDMPIFSMSPVDRKVLGNWQLVIDMPALKEGIKKRLESFDYKDGILDIEFTDSRQVASIVQLVADILPSSRFDYRIGMGDGVIHGFILSTAIHMTVNDAANATIEPGLEYLMLLNTWRSMISQLSGPAIGFDFNITIAGIVATCLRLGVDVQFESV